MARGYKDALEAAGATVHAFESFGSYQGEWIASVSYEGKDGFVHGWYGSCSGCDAFEAEFGWDDPEDADKLARFGRRYLDDLTEKGELLREFKEQATWDMGAEDIVSWLQRQGA